MDLSIDTTGEPVESIPNEVLPTDVPPEQVAVSHSTYVEELPVTGNSSNVARQVTWSIQPNADTLVDLANSFIVTTLQIRNSTSVASRQDEIYPTTMLGDALWSNMRLRVNGVDLADNAGLGDGTYPYLALFSNAFHKPSEWSSGKLITYGELLPTGAIGTFPALLNEFQKSADVHGHPTGSSEYAEIEEGWPHSSSLCTHSAAAAMRGVTARTQTQKLPNTELVRIVTRPKLAFWRQLGYLPTNVSIRLELTKSPDALICLRAKTGTPVPEVDWSVGSCSLWLRHVSPASATAAAAARYIIERPLRYPIDEFAMETFPIKWDGAKTVTNPGMFAGGSRPNLICMLIVPQIAFSGTGYFDWSQGNAGRIDPIAVESANNSQDSAPNPTNLYLTWGGQPYPQMPYVQQSSLDLARLYEVYRSKCDDPENPLLSYTKFCYHATLYVFDLSKDLDKPGEVAGYYAERATATITMQLPAPPAASVGPPPLTTGDHYYEDNVAIVGAYRPAIVSIDGSRRIVVVR